MDGFWEFSYRFKGQNTVLHLLCPHVSTKSRQQLLLLAMFSPFICWFLFFVMSLVTPEAVFAQLKGKFFFIYNCS